jgi:hypothetical protein
MSMRIILEVIAGLNDVRRLSNPSRIDIGISRLRRRYLGHVRKMEPVAMSLSSCLKIVGLAAALLADPIAAAQAEIVTPLPAAIAPIDAGVKPWPAPAGHRQPHASDVPPDTRQDADIRDEEAVDRKLGICRRC